MLHYDRFKYLRLHFRATRCPHEQCTCLWTVFETPNAFSIFIDVKMFVLEMSVAFSNFLFPNFQGTAGKLFCEGFWPDFLNVEFISCIDL